MAQIGSLVIDLIAETASFNANVVKAANTLNSNAAKMTRAVDSIQKKMDGLRNAGQALAGVLAVRELTGAVDRALDYAASLGEVSQQIGVTVKDLQTYRYIGSQVNVTQEEMEKALAKLSVTAGQAALGLQAPKKAFAALGIEVRDSAGHVKTAGALIPEIAAKLATIPDPAQRAAAEVALFGRAGQKLDPLLSQGASGIKAFADRAEQMGLILSDDLASGADKAADRIAELKMQLNATFARAVAQNAEAIMGLANAIATLTVRAAQWIAKYPAFAGATAGAAIGSRAGLPGAGIGAVAGYIAGDQLGTASADANMDIKFRIAQVKAANDYMKTRARIERAGMGFSIYKTIADPTGGRAGGTLESARQYTEYQTGLLKKAMAARAAGALPALPAVNDLGDFLAGGGGGGKGRKTTDKAAEAAKKITEEFAKQLASMGDQVRIGQLLGESDAYREQQLRGEAELREQLKGIDSKRLAIALDMNSALAAQAAHAQGWRDLVQEAKDTKPIAVPDEMKAESALKKIANWNDKTVKAAKDSWATVTHSIIGAFDDAAQGIQNGNFLQTLQGIVDIFLNLGSLGVFGGKLATSINASRQPGFAGGGYTGNGSPAAVAGVVHRQEFVFDAAATSRIGADNLERLRRGQAFGRGGAGGGRMTAYLDRAERMPPVQIVPSPLFDAVVGGIATNVAAPMVTRGVGASVGLAETRNAQRRRQVIPSRRS